MRSKLIVGLTIVGMVLGSMACERGGTNPAEQDASAAESAPAEEKKPQRIITLGGAMTEIAFALGAGDEVVGVDLTSSYPAEVEELTRVGMFRSIGAEGILSLTPTVVLSVEGVGPDNAVSQVRAAGIDLQVFEDPRDFEGARQRIEKVAEVLGRKDQAESVIAAMRTDYERAREIAASSSVQPRVLFLYARGANTLLVGGKNTSADSMIELAGGVNAVDFDGFKPLSPEGLIAAQPDVLLMAEKGVESLGVEELWKLNGLEQTPAGRERRLITIDDAKLIGLGPRFGSALVEVATQLHAADGSKDSVGER